MTNRRWRAALDVALALYLVALVWLTFGPHPKLPDIGPPPGSITAGGQASPTAGASPSPQHPLTRAERRRLAQQRAAARAERSADTERGANVLLFVPGGLLLMLRTRWSAVRTLGVLVATSAAIEVLQWTLATWRSASVGDVVMNGTGALVGVTAGALLRRLWRTDRRSVTDGPLR